MSSITITSFNHNHKMNLYRAANNMDSGAEQNKMRFKKKNKQIKGNHRISLRI